MSYFPCDIPFMSDDELKENGIHIPKNLPDTNVGNIEYIRKQDVSDWLKQYGQDVLHGKYKFSLMYIWKKLMDLPSADVAPVVRCKDCRYRVDPDKCCHPDGMLRSKDNGFCSYGTKIDEGCEEEE